MNAIVFIRFGAKNRIESVNTYGSIVSMLNEQVITLEGKSLEKRAIYYQMEKSPVLEADNCRIEKTTVKRA